MAALGLLAFAASAQAEAGGKWLYLLTPGGVVDEIPSGTEVEAEAETDFTLLTTVGGTAVKILCQKFKASEAKLESEGKSLGKLEFTTCETFLNGTLTASCKPAEPITATVKDLLVLHNSVTYDVFEPDTTGKSAEEIAEERFVQIALGATCTIGNKFNVKGLLPIKECSPNTLETHLVTHLIEEVQSLFAGQTEGGKTLPSYKLKFGANAATLDGSANLRLLGAGFTGKEWFAKV
jgi:hypothetical protein